MSIHTMPVGKPMEHIEHTGSTAQPYQFVGELGYYTHWQDENLTLLQLGVRFYDPEIGRFGQRDPLETGINHHVYASDNPLGYADPGGMYANRQSEEQTWIKACVAKCVAANESDALPPHWPACIMTLGAAISGFCGCEAFATACITSSVFYEMIRDSIQAALRQRCEDFCQARLANWQRRWLKEWIRLHPGKRPPKPPVPPDSYQWDQDDFNGYVEKIWLPANCPPTPRPEPGDVFDPIITPRL